MLKGWDGGLRCHDVHCGCVALMGMIACVPCRRRGNEKLRVSGVQSVQGADVAVVREAIFSCGCFQVLVFSLL
jgi:hypothetical protein